MTPPLALHHFTLCDVSPGELVTIADQVGCRAVCLFVDSPAEPAPGQQLAPPAFPTVTPASAPELIARLRDSDLSVSNVEFFPLGSNTRLVDFRPALDLGAALGARLAVTHVHDTNHDRAIDTLSGFTELAATAGLAVGLEFMPLSPGCVDLHQAEALVRAARQRNLGIAIDALHHFRSGGTVRQLQELDPALVAYAQLCDAPAATPGPIDAGRYLAEAFDRLAPGTGVLPLAAMVAALPEHTHFDVEVPSPTLAARGIRALERARRAVTASRAVLAAAGRTLP